MKVMNIEEGFSFKSVKNLQKYNYEVMYTAGIEEENPPDRYDKNNLSEHDIDRIWATA